MSEQEKVVSCYQKMYRCMAGKICAWGISETMEDYLRRASAVCPVTAVQNPY